MEVQEEEEQQAHQILLSANKRLRNNTVMILGDILFDEILIRLPAKFLVRFRLVCKSWKHVFSTPEFVKAHFTRQQSDSDQDLLIAHKYNSYNLHRNPVIIVISRSSEFPVTAGPWCSKTLLGSINGLVCMASGNNFCLWNPAMGQIKEICFPSRCYEHCQHLLGFSWDHVSDDYKVVIVCHVSRCSTRYLYIYSCKSASWTQVLIPHNAVPDDTHIFHNMAPCTFVKGIPYWTCTKFASSAHFHAYMYVFKFVAENNDFRSLPRLDLDFKRRKDRKFFLVNIKDCLVGMVHVQGCRNCVVHMFSLDEESDNGVWSKMCTIGPINLCNRNWWLSQCFKNGGEIMIERNGSLFIYNPETKETQTVKSRKHFFIKRCYSYTPSLICVQGMVPIVLFPFQEMQLKKLAIEYRNLVGRS